MQSPDVQLVTFVCIAAFLAVFLLLVILASAMRLLIAVFPEKVARSDPALVAAVTTAVSAAYPGMHITKVEEER